MIVAYLKQDDSHGFTEAFHLQGPSHMCSSTYFIQCTYADTDVSTFQDYAIKLAHLIWFVCVIVLKLTIYVVTIIRESCSTFEAKLKACLSKATP